MKNSFVRFCALACMAFAFCVISISAQTSSDINRFEGYVGYSPMGLDTGLDSSDFDFDPTIADGLDKYTFAHGINASVTANFTKYIGAKFDFSTHRKSEDSDFDGETLKETFRVNQFLGGLQFKNNSKEGPRFKPFAHVLAGVARQTDKVSGAAVQDFTGENEISVSASDFAMVFGGGIDIKATKNIDIRAFQIDYNPIFRGDHDFFGETLPSGTQHNVRFSFGIVFH